MSRPPSLLQHGFRNGFKVVTESWRWPWSQIRSYCYYSPPLPRCDHLRSAVSRRAGRLDLAVDLALLLLLLLPRLLLLPLLFLDLLLLLTARFFSFCFGIASKQKDVQTKTFDLPGRSWRVQATTKMYATTCPATPPATLVRCARPRPIAMEAYRATWRRNHQTATFHLLWPHLKRFRRHCSFMYML